MWKGTSAGGRSRLCSEGRGRRPQVLGAGRLAERAAAAPRPAQHRTRSHTGSAREQPPASHWSPSSACHSTPLGSQAPGPGAARPGSPVSSETRASRASAEGAQPWPLRPPWGQARPPWEAACARPRPGALGAPTGGTRAGCRVLPAGRTRAFEQLLFRRQVGRCGNDSPGYSPDPRRGLYRPYQSTSLKEGQRT